MFKETIRSTPFNTDAANEYFNDKIYGSTFNGDDSFVSTLRGLLSNRINDGHIHFKVINNRVRFTDEATTIGDSMCNFDPYDEDMITLCMFSPSSDGDKNVLEMISRVFPTRDYAEGWTKLDKVTALFSKAFEIICYINPEKRSVVMFTPSMSLRKYHLLQCSILGILPWYFNPKDGISDVEMSLIKSFTASTTDSDGKVSNNGSVSQYMDALGKIANNLDFESARLEKLLKGIESRFEEKEIEKIKSEIDESDRRIASHNETINEILREISEYNIRLLGLIASKESKKEDSEILEYFKRNKNIYLDDVSRDKIRFSVKGNIEIFDEEVVKRTLDNKDSFVYSNKPASISSEAIKGLMTRVFIGQDVYVRFCAAYALDMNGGVEGLSNHEFTAPMFAGYMPNPHIQYYSCLGSYGPVLNGLMRKGAYIEALEQCSVSAKSLNWCDSAVMIRFFEWLYENRYECFEMPDGSVCNLKGALAWIDREKENAEKETEA